jgi:hypothetical protein
MSNTQPQALRLADALEQAPAHTQEDGTVLLYLGGTVVADKAAAELRRLSAQTDNDTALLRQALEALESRAVNDYFVEHISAAITALRERLGEKK